ncbi:MAG: type II toxin-antitoxin system prevent-host-death family antitoxin [Gemmatimonadales bacterium]|nr:type II toxin-antitoxin system prevent-host-death family antitoxin [Gemmatimonadales bacterium]
MAAKPRKPAVVRESLVLPLPAAIPAGQFKARCLELMDRVRAQGGEIVITKHGEPVAKLVPVETPLQPESGFGCMKGTITIFGDIIAPVEDEDW